MLDAAVAVLGEHGYHGLSIREVSRRSGIPKSTIYRRWESKVDLVRIVLGQSADRQGSPPDMGSLRGDLVELLRRQIASITPPTSGVVQIAFDARSDPVLGPMVRALARDRRQVYSVVFERARARRDVADHVDSDLAFDLVWGPVWSRFSPELPSIGPPPIAEVSETGVLSEISGAFRGSGRVPRGGLADPT